MELYVSNPMDVRIKNDGKKSEEYMLNFYRYIVVMLSEMGVYWIFSINIVYNITLYNDNNVNDNNNSYDRWKVGFIPNDFGGINSVYSIKHMILIGVMFYRHYRLRDVYVVDVLYHVASLAFWVVTTVFFYDRNDNNFTSSSWVVRNNEWTTYMLLMPGLKIFFDALLWLTSAFFFTDSGYFSKAKYYLYTDVQYVLIFMQLSGTVDFKHPMLLYIMIFVASGVAIFYSFCYGLIFTGIKLIKDQNFKGQKYFKSFISIKILQFASCVIFFIWECVVGSLTTYPPGIHYVLVFAVFVLSVASLLEAFWSYRLRPIAEGTKPQPQPSADQSTIHRANLISHDPNAPNPEIKPLN